MNNFELFELKTELDFENFCKILLESKGIAPRSLSCIISLTMQRDAQILEREEDPGWKAIEVERKIRGMLCP